MASAGSPTSATTAAAPRRLTNLWAYSRLTLLLPVAVVALLWAGSSVLHARGDGSGRGGSAGARLASAYADAFAASHAGSGAAADIAPSPTAAADDAAELAPLSPLAAAAAALVAAVAPPSAAAAGAAGGATPSPWPAGVYRSLHYAAGTPQDAAGWRAWASEPLEARFSPSRATPPSPLAPGGRYAYWMLVVEGFGAWSDAIYETINLAVRLNRSWVEPCVRNGCIEPCRFGHVRPVPAWSAGAGAAAAAAGVDPGLLPRIADDCKIDLPPRSAPLDSVAEAYPLSAYVDVAAVAAQYPPGTVVSYADWAASYVAEHAPAADAAAGGRWAAHHAYNFDMQHGGVTGAVAVGDFSFADTIIGRVAPERFAPGFDRTSREAVFEMLAADASPTLFFYHYYRSMFALYFEFPVVPLSPWHTAAVAAYVRGPLAGPPYAAFHWRSEGVDFGALGKCAGELAGLATALLPAAFPPDGPGAVLLADMPAPANPARMWNDYANGNSAEQKGAMATMLAAGFHKYDAAVYAAAADAAAATAGGAVTHLDAGVFSVRDYLLAVGADWYITCQGDHWETCHGCFRAGSNIVWRIKKDREAVGKPVEFFWFDVKDADPSRVPESLRGPRGAPANASAARPPQRLR